MDIPIQTIFPQLYPIMIEFLFRLHHFVEDRRSMIIFITDVVIVHFNQLYS
jgi:hypothetical protein